MHEKGLGYAFMTIGILIMAISVFFLYLVFTNQIKPFTVFQEPVKVTNKNNSPSIDGLISDPSNIVQMQKQIVTEVLEKQINKTMNVLSTVFLMYFLMLFGFRLATLGTQLVRPINVNLKEANTPPKPPPDQ